MSSRHLSPQVHQCTDKATGDGRGPNKQSLKNRPTVVMRTEGATLCPCTSQSEGTTGIPIEVDGCRTNFSCSETEGMRKHLSKVHSIHFVTILLGNGAVATNNAITNCSGRGPPTLTTAR